MRLVHAARFTACVLLMSAMFSHATRKASISAMAPTVDLSLDGAGHSEPIIVDDEAEVDPPPPPDLSVSSASLVRDVLTPVLSTSL